MVMIVDLCLVFCVFFCKPVDAVKSAACLVSVPEVQSLIHHFEAVLGTLPRACAPIPECKESHKLLR